MSRLSLSTRLFLLPSARPLLVAAMLLSLGSASACNKTGEGEPLTPEDELPGGETVELEKPPAPILDKRVGEAQKMLKAGEHQAALDLMDEALVDEPDSGDLHYGRGMALSFMPERDEEALAAYDRALELDPGLVQALVARGNMQAFVFGDVDAARKDFDRAIELAPRFAPSFHGRGTIRLDAKDFQGAVEDLSRAAELDDKNANTLYVLAQAYAAQENAAKALEVATQAVELEPGTSGVDLRFLKAALLLATGDKAAAIAEYEGIGALLPDNPDVRLEVGRNILRAGDPAKAIGHFEAVAQALPEAPAPLVNWGRALAASGELDAAIAKFDAALKLDANSPAAHVYKIEVLAAAGKCAEAKKAKKAFKKPGDDSVARIEKALEACAAG